MSSSQDTSFYVTLPSNVPDPSNKNTVSDFRVSLAQSLNFRNEPWEVSLSEIFVPNFIYNIHGQMGTFLARIIRRNKEAFFAQGTIRPGMYTPKSFCFRLNKVLETLRFGSLQGVMLDYSTEAGVDHNSFKGHCSFDKNLRALVFYLAAGETLEWPDAKMKSLLGVPLGMGPIGSERVKDRSLPDMAQFYRHIDQMYVYCGAVRDSQVGHVMSPLLRVVDMGEAARRDDDRTVIHWSYGDGEQYKDLRVNEIKDIHIQLLDSTGEEMRFQGGGVTLVLHFRKKKPLVT